MQKKDLIAAFNIQFMELWDDVLRVFPKDTEIRAGRLVVKGVLHVSQTKIYRTFKQSVYDLYSDKIMEGDLEYFLEKKYDDDVKSLDSGVLSKIDSLRDPIRRMDKADKETFTSYMQNLCKLVEAAEAAGKEGVERE